MVSSQKRSSAARFSSSSSFEASSVTASFADRSSPSIGRRGGESSNAPAALDSRAIAESEGSKPKTRGATGTANATRSAGAMRTGPAITRLRATAGRKASTPPPRPRCRKEPARLAGSRPIDRVSEHALMRFLRHVVIPAAIDHDAASDRRDSDEDRAILPRERLHLPAVHVDRNRRVRVRDRAADAFDDRVLLDHAARGAVRSRALEEAGRAEEADVVVAAAAHDDAAVASEALDRRRRLLRDLGAGPA